MSQWALLMGCRDILRAPKAPQQSGLTGLGLSNLQCDINFDGQPVPACGELFVCIFPGAWMVSDAEGLDESFDINITVTVRMSVLPSDRQTAVTPLSSLGGKAMAQKLEEIRALLHLDNVQDQWLQRANFYLGALEGAGGAFVEPPRLRGIAAPQAQGPEWFSAERDVAGQILPCGLSQTMTFGGARRVQRIEGEE